MKKKFHCFLLPLLVAGLSAAAPAASLPAPTETHHYLKTTGATQVPFSWQLISGENLKLITFLGAEKDITRMTPDLATYAWEVDDPKAKTRLLVRRERNQLLLSGLFKGKPLQKRIQIDAAPWYQALSMSLRQFTDTGKKRLEFWSLRPDTLDVHRLQVSSKGEETLAVNGEPCAALKLKIQLTGLKSAFWSCHYWLRKEDGLFVRYEGPSGPPGRPLTRVELSGSCLQAARQRK